MKGCRSQQKSHNFIHASAPEGPNASNWTDRGPNQPLTPHHSVPCLFVSNLPYGTHLTNPAHITTSLWSHPSEQPIWDSQLAVVVVVALNRSVNPVLTGATLLTSLSTLVKKEITFVTTSLLRKIKGDNLFISNCKLLPLHKFCILVLNALLKRWKVLWRCAGL